MSEFNEEAGLKVCHTKNWISRTPEVRMKFVTELGSWGRRGDRRSLRLCSHAFMRQTQDEQIPLSTPFSTSLSSPDSTFHQFPLHDPLTQGPSDEDSRVQNRRRMVTFTGFGSVTVDRHFGHGTCPKSHDGHEDSDSLRIVQFNLREVHVICPHYEVLPGQCLGKGVVGSRHEEYFRYSKRCPHESCAPGSVLIRD